MPYVIEEITIERRYAVCDECSCRVPWGDEHSHPVLHPPGWICWLGEGGEKIWCGPECCMKFLDRRYGRTVEHKPPEPGTIK